jgi:hypothetical protein
MLTKTAIIDFLDHLSEWAEGRAAKIRANTATFRREAVLRRNAAYLYEYMTEIVTPETVGSSAGLTSDVARMVAVAKARCLLDRINDELGDLP